MAGEMVHIEIPTDDTAAQREFWGSLFGWQFESFPGPFEYHIARIDDRSGAAVMTTESGARDAHVLLRRRHQRRRRAGEGARRRVGRPDARAEHGLVRHVHGSVRQRVRPLADRPGRVDVARRYPSSSTRSAASSISSGSCVAQTTAVRRVGVARASSVARSRARSPRRGGRSARRAGAGRRPRRARGRSRPAGARRPRAGRPDAAAAPRARRRRAHSRVRRRPGRRGASRPSSTFSSAVRYGTSPGSWVTSATWRRRSAASSERGQAAERRARDRDRSARRALEPGEEVEQGRLAASRPADHGASAGRRANAAERSSSTTRAP